MLEPAITDRAADDPRGTRVMLRRELLAEGMHDRAIAARVRRGEWAKPRRGAYVSARDWLQLDREGRHEVVVRAVLKAAQTELVVSHQSAVSFHGAPTWGLDLKEVQVTRDDAATGHAEAGVRQHRGILLPGDVTTRYGVRVTSAARTALEVTTTSDAEPALVVMNHLCHVGATSPQEIRDRYAHSMEHWPDTLKTDLVIRLCDPRLESVGETRFVYLCFRQGLPAPIPQYEVRDASGRVIARLDFAWPELGAFAEFDGKVKYTGLLRASETPGDVVFREKQREDLVREITGWRGMRVVWSDYDRPDLTGARVRRLLYPATSDAG